MKSVLAVSIGLMFCSGAAAQPTTRATVETIVADMKNMNDFPLKGYETFSSGWYVGPGHNLMGSNTDFNTNQAKWSIYYNNPKYKNVVAKAILPWVAVFDGHDHHAPNTAVEISDLMFYVKLKSTAKWKLMAGPVSVSGDLYGKKEQHNKNTKGVVISKSLTNIVIEVPQSNYFWHGWSDAGRQTVDPRDIAAIHLRVKGRLTVKPNRVDDRAKAQLGLQLGADWYVDSATSYKEAYAPAALIARTKRLGNDWTVFTATTLTDVGAQEPGAGITEAELRTLPPPL